MKLRVVQAHEGDCLLLFWKGASEHAMLIDGGARDTFTPHLRAALADDGVKDLDILMVSHVDTDHTTGVNELLAELQRQKDNGQAPALTIRDLWFNSFSTTVDRNGKLASGLSSLATNLAGAGVASAGLASSLAGIADGHRITTRAAALGIPINDANKGSPLLLEDAEIVYTLDKLVLQVVGPTSHNLDELERSWEAWLVKQNARLKAGLKGLAAMADRSVPNLASIQVLVTHEDSGKRILFTGDGRGDHLLDALEALDLLDADGGIDVDVLKVAHHGSNRNSTLGFYERVRATTYIVSADGKHDNPDVDTLSWIARAAKKQGRPITVVVTNAPASVKEFTKRWPADEFGYTLVERDPARSYIDLEV